METQSPLPVLIWVVPAVCGLVTLAVGRWRREFQGWLAFAGLAVTVVISGLIAQSVLAGWVLTAWNNTLRVDGLSALMEVLASLIGMIIVVYSLRYIPGRLDIEEPRRLGGPVPRDVRLSSYYGLLLLFLGMMNWTCATNSLVWLYVSLELTTLATALLVIFYWNRESLEAGYKYLMLVTVGVLFALMGLGLIYAAAAGLPGTEGRGVLLITEVGKVARQMPKALVLLANVFLVVGFGTKAGLAPFHAWLPDAHAEAPEPISALLSGIVIKVGAYALARTITLFAPQPDYGAVVVFVAIMASASMVIGILMALVQDDLKRMLAYSSVSQIGYVIEGLGLGTYLGIYGGLFHLINHSLIKALLFLAAGAIVYVTGTRRISELGGLRQRAPITAFCFLVGALAIGGLPPFSAFMSKFTLFLAAAQKGLLWAAIIAVFTGLLTVACFVRAAYLICWGMRRGVADCGLQAAAKSGIRNPKSEIALGSEREVPVAIWTGMAVLVVLTVGLGLFPNLAYPLLDRATVCIQALLPAS